MCGIAGQVRGDGRPVDAGLIARMCAAVEHRGPDSRGAHVRGRVGLGIQRLRVIDLATGDQPVFNEDGSVAVVLNGEIYNYRELRERLRRAGHRFRSVGDTEAIAHLYEEEGPACVASLAGMFAFALWDERRGRLLVARDRVGKKPLFYSLRAGTLTFASELGALLCDDEISRELDPQALDQYFTLGYVPDPRSAFAAVHKLPPGSTLVLEGGEARIERYWELDYGRRPQTENAADAADVVRDAVRHAVRRRMVADVPLGAFLSGGIDSSAVVAAMAEASPQPVKTFSIGFGHDGYDELPHARRVAELFGTDHRELVVRPDAVAILPRLVRHYGEPFADHSAIPSFYLAEMARRHVTVALNGDGGDESFGGYGRYANAGVIARLARLPLSVRRALAALGGRVPSDGRETSARNRVRRVAGMLPLDAGERYLLAVSQLAWLARDGAYTAEFRARVHDHATADAILGPWERSSATTLVDRMLDVDVRTYLPGDLLTKIDIATMAHGLEARSPLLDHELMEVAAALPARLKVAGREKKVALRAALRGWLPDEILDRPKQGFQVPMAAWLRGDLGRMAADLLLEPDAAVGAYVRPEYTRGLLERHRAGREDGSAMLWKLLFFEAWHQDVVQGSAVTGALAVA